MNHLSHHTTTLRRRVDFVSQRLLAAIQLLLLGLILTIAPRAAGQCSQWAFNGAFNLNSPGSDVNDMLTFDLDGGGPQPARLIAATDNGVWVWDTVNWRLLGEGLRQVTALAIFNGSLVATDNDFAATNDNFVVRWAGNGWVYLGGTFGFGNGVGQPRVNALAVFQGELIAGGSFTHVGGVTFPSRNIAKWNGSTWTALGVGVTVPIRAMAVFDLDGAGPNAARLVVGGYTLDIQPSFPVFYVPFQAVWTESDWIIAPVQDVPCAVLDLREVAGNFYMCGVRSAPGGNPLVEAAVLARWSSALSQWTTVTSIVDSALTGSYMNSMTEWNGNVVVVGRFEFNGSENVLLFNGTSGLPLLGGQPGFEVAAATVLGTDLVVAERLSGVAQYNDFAWAPVNSNGFGQAFATIGSRLVVGGNFTRLLPGSEPAYNLVGWNGSVVSNIGPGTGTNGTVRALKSFSAFSTNHLIAGGDFTQVGSQGGIGEGLEGGGAVLANRIAMWNDGLLGGGWSAMGNGFNGSVLAVERVAASQFTGAATYAGGEFTAAGTGSPGFSRVAQWFDSTSSWTPMGTGFNNRVRALKARNINQIAREVLAAGDFTSAGGVAANRIAIWNTPGNPPAWAPMGSGFNGPVHAIERHNGIIYAAGDFTASGAVPTVRIARWDGTAWLVVGNSIGFNGTVRALLSTGEFLYAAGDFTSVDGVPADHIARWNGAVWADAGSDSNVPGLALGTFHGEVHAGLASDDTSLRYLASAPWIVQQPSSQTVPCGQSVTFQVFAAPAYTGLIYTWRKNDEPLTAGPTGHGSSIALNLNQMTISNVQALDAGAYDCVLSSAECNSTISSAAMLTVSGTCPPACPADLNGDQVVGVPDLLVVINAWGPCRAPCAADIAPPGGDGAVGVPDLLMIINNWGACP